MPLAHGIKMSSILRSREDIESANLVKSKGYLIPAKVNGYHSPSLAGSSLSSSNPIRFRHSPEF
jgi:hypothetical protein